MNYERICGGRFAECERLRFAIYAKKSACIIQVRELIEAFAYHICFHGFFFVRLA